MTDESVPQDCEQLKKAIAATKPGEKDRQRYLIKRSIELGCVDNIPDDWTVTNNGGTAEK